MASTSALNAKSDRVKRRPSKTMYLGKLEIVEASRSPQTPKRVASRILKKLWKFQKDALHFTLKRKGSFLAMEMGTGKTLTTLASVAVRHWWGSVDRVLIVCPACAIDVWRRHIEEFMPGTTIEFAILSFEFSRFYFKYLRKDKWDVIIVDESHKLKNPNSQQSRRIGKIAVHCTYKYCLTGTEITKWVPDLFGQFRVVNDNVLGDNWPRFRERYLYKTGYMGYKLGIRRVNKKKILKLCTPHMFHITRKEALGLPGVTPPVILTARLKGEQKRVYNEIARKSISFVNGRAVTTRNALTQQLRLQQIVGGHVPDEEGRLITFPSEKFRLLDEFLKDWDKDEKLVIFARFIYELEQIEKLCKKHRLPCYIYKPKEAHLDREFQSKNTKLRVSISQIQRGGVARDLFAASTAVYLSKTFSWSDYIQSIARLDRAGQTKPVTPVFILMKGTVDDLIELAIAGRWSEAKFARKFMEYLRKNRLT